MNAQEFSNALRAGLADLPKRRGTPETFLCRDIDEFVAHWAALKADQSGAGDAARWMFERLRNISFEAGLVTRGELPAQWQFEIPDIARENDISVKTVQRAIRAGELGGHRYSGRLTLVDRPDLEAWPRNTAKIRSGPPRRVREVYFPKDVASDFGVPVGLVYRAVHARRLVSDEQGKIGHAALLAWREECRLAAVSPRAADIVLSGGHGGLNTGGPNVELGSIL